jgi:hypothetical protein
MSGIDRPELFENDEQSRHVTFHSLRHTYATWLALAGVDPLVIQQRGGWANLRMVQRYVEEAEAVGRGRIGVPFPPIPTALVAGVRGGLPDQQSSLESSEDSCGVLQPVDIEGENVTSNNSAHTVATYKPTRIPPLQDGTPKQTPAVSFETPRIRFPQDDSKTIPETNQNANDCILLMKAMRVAVDAADSATVARIAEE